MRTVIEHVKETLKLFNIRLFYLQLEHNSYEENSVEAIVRKFCYIGLSDEQDNKWSLKVIFNFRKEAKTELRFSKS